MSPEPGTILIHRSAGTLVRVLGPDRLGNRCGYKVHVIGEGRDLFLDSEDLGSWKVIETYENALDILENIKKALESWDGMVEHLERSGKSEEFVRGYDEALRDARRWILEILRSE